MQNLVQIRVTMFAVAAVLGLVTGYIWARYIKAAAHSKPGEAALMDGALMLPTLVNYQIWSYMGNNFFILMSFLVGSMVGTYFGVKQGA